MKVSLLTSGFPNGFTDDFVKCVKEYYLMTGSFVFIASDFSGYSKTDHYSDVILKMFRDKGIVFDEVHVIDDRISKEKAVQDIEEADVIWISGGNTLEQIKYLKQYNLLPALQSRDCIIIGMSAGSINMAKKVVLAKDIDDNIPELSIYDGIGLVDINIEPHLDSASKKHIEEDIYEASQVATIYGLYDNSFVKIVDDKMDIFGDYFKYENTGK
ncbi:Type 1 glutamine amidotransferase-like domain-containing protein [Gorillibacterium timonense]|uniref:Type 1 glutamine amidotransferase-like domain-containing protein n=1 Tax=Gorillibacterium timonense TaxID=1689269 RepID=UPI00071CE84C|nr:Type 1 glutamine amidotransferase-like domain-containing protein [Gorillibacterium timonense]